MVRITFQRRGLFSFSSFRGEDCEREREGERGEKVERLILSTKREMGKGKGKGSKIGLDERSTRISRGPETMEVSSIVEHAHFFAVPISPEPLRAFYLVVDWCGGNSSGN